MNKVQPLVRRKNVHKRSKKFVRHFADLIPGLGKTSWRKPTGIDNRQRRRYKGARPLVHIGYGTNRKTKHICPDGFLRFRVFNVKELDLLLMHNRKYAVEIAAGVSSKKRKDIVERADQLGLKVVNREAKLKAQEHE